jgi:hypothetical protein
MNHFKLLAFVLAIGFATVSCSDKGEVIPSVSGNKYESTYAKLVVDGPVTISRSLKSKEELEDANLYNVIEFKADGTFYINDEKLATWTQTDGSLSIAYEEETRTASVSGDKVTMSIDETIQGSATSVTVEYTKL